MRRLPPSRRWLRSSLNGTGCIWPWVIARNCAKGSAKASRVEALKLNPDDVRLVEALARSYVVQKQSDKALEVVRQYASERPKSAAAQQFLGNWLLRNGDRAGARTAFAAAQAADPSYTAADLVLAQLDIA